MTDTNLDADVAAAFNEVRDAVPTTSMRTRRKKQPNAVLLVVVLFPFAIASTLFVYALFARIGFVAGVERTCPASTERCACIVEHLKSDTTWLDNMLMAFDHSLAEDAGRHAARACSEGAR